jgi:hypothetical protein
MFLTTTFRPLPLGGDEDQIAVRRINRATDERDMSATRRPRRRLIGTRAYVAHQAQQTRAEIHDEDHHPGSCVDLDCDRSLVGRPRHRPVSVGLDADRESPDRFAAQRVDADNSRRPRVTGRGEPPAARREDISSEWATSAAAVGVHHPQLRVARGMRVAAVYPAERDQSALSDPVRSTQRIQPAPRGVGGGRRGDEKRCRHDRCTPPTPHHSSPSHRVTPLNDRAGGGPLTSGRKCGNRDAGAPRHVQECPADEPFAERAEPVQNRHEKRTHAREGNGDKGTLPGTDALAEPTKHPRHGVLTCSA